MGNSADNPIFREEDLKKVLVDLNISLVYFINSRGEIGPFIDAVKRWEDVRQRINNVTNMGIVVGAIWDLAIFPLSGDIERDAGQINFTKLEKSD